MIFTSRLFVLCAVTLIAACSQKSDLPTKHARTSEEIKSFWQREVQHLVEQLVLGTLPYPEVNERFKASHQLIIARTGKGLSFNLNTNYHWVHMRAEASAGMDYSNNTAKISMHVPALADTFDMLERTGDPNWRKAFTSHIIILTMHEIEHLIYEKKAPVKIDIKEESRAWIETCRYTIAPLIEQYQLPLYESDWNMYQAWKGAGGDPSHPVWVERMSTLYGDIDGKTEHK